MGVVTDIRSAIAGRKGGKGGGSGGHVPTEAPNTLRSKAIARVFDMVSEGPIRGLVDGERSIFFNDVPLQNEDESYNFTGVKWWERLGTTNQAPVNGFPAVEREISVGTQVFHFTGGGRQIEAVDKNTDRLTINGHGFVTGSGPFRLTTSEALPGGLALNRDYWVIRVNSDVIKLATSVTNANSGIAVNITSKGKGTHTIGIVSTGVVQQITDSNVDAVRVTLRIPALTFQDPKTGDLRGNSVGLAIDVRENGGDWVEQMIDDRWIAFSEKTPDLTRAIRVTVKDTTAGGVYKEAGALEAEYRMVGASTWLTLGSWSGTITNSVERINYGHGEFETVFLPTEYRKTFSVSGLAPGEYEVRITQGVLHAQEAYAISPILIDGKTTSPFEASYRVELPEGGAPWDVRVRRTSGDFSSVNIQNQSWWARYTEIIDHKLYYPDCAYYAVAADAEQFNGEIARRAYEIYGLEVQVPLNYDPDLRTYATEGEGTTNGTWNGEFKTAWTNNPAWVFYALATNKRWGLGQWIDPALVDKWALYEIAKYCDEFVEDGFGGVEPRFTFNGVINTREEAIRVLQLIASAFRGMVYWGAGTVVATQDRPTSAKILVSPANVIGGEFTYSGTGYNARHSAVLVTWNNPENGYRPDIELVEDPELIDRYGWKPTDVVAVGCTSRGQAHRLGKWILDSEKNETETVVYRASFDHMVADGTAVMPGDVIRIADPSYAGVRMGGRVVSATTTEVEVDAPVTLQSGETYTLAVVLPDGTLGEAEITNQNGEFTVLLLATALPAVPEAGAMWVITGSDVAPREFRVVNVAEVEKNVVEVTALFHDPTKYARVEQGLVLDPPSYSAIPSGKIDQPTGLSVKEYLYRAGPNVKSAATFSWEPSPDPRVQLYEAEVRRAGDTSFATIGITGGVSVDVQDTEDGLYGFRVRAIDGVGNRSKWAVLDPYQLLSLEARPSGVTGLRINRLGPNATLTWDPVPDLDVSHYRVKFTPTVVGLASWATAADLVTKVVGNQVQVPSMAGTYFVKAVDTSGNESEFAAGLWSGGADIEELNIVETLIDEPTFLGAKENCEVLGTDLILTDTQTLASWTTEEYCEELGLDFASISGSGTYEFAETVDLTDVFTSRVTSEIEAFGTDQGNVMANWVSLAALESMAGGDPENWGVILQMRTTNDDPAGTPVWSDWSNLVVGDYEFRACQFRLLLFSYAANTTPNVRTLRATVDMPDRVIGQYNIVCPADPGYVDIVFDGAFKERPALGFTDHDMATGDYKLVTNHSKTGFRVAYKDAAGNPVTRTFDWIARGYGKLTS